MNHVGNGKQEIEGLRKFVPHAITHVSMFDGFQHESQHDACPRYADVGGNQKPAQAGRIFRVRVVVGHR